MIVADYNTSVLTNANNIESANTPPDDTLVTSIYTMKLSCEFELQKVIHENPDHLEKMWKSTFTRQKQFPSSVLLGVQGTSSALINESEADRALFDLATNMMDDVHESMLAMF